MQALMVGPAHPARPHGSSVKDWEALQVKTPLASPAGHGLQLTPPSCFLCSDAIRAWAGMLLSGYPG